MGKQTSVVYGIIIENGQAERTTPVRNRSRMTAGGLPVNARSGGRLELRLRAREAWSLEPGRAY